MMPPVRGRFCQPSEKAGPEPSPSLTHLQRKFLGYTVTNHRSPRLKPAPQSVKRAKDRIREITQKGRGRNILQVIKEVNQFTRGWVGYFRLATVKQAFEDLDQWL